MKPRNLVYTRQSQNPQPGPQLTTPGQAMSVAEHLRRFTSGTLIERLEGLYYDSVTFPDEQNPPDLSKLDRIERMELLNAKKLQLQNYYDLMEAAGQPTDQQQIDDIKLQASQLAAQNREADEQTGTPDQ